jgi:hypothetical protein
MWRRVALAASIVLVGGMTGAALVGAPASASGSGPHFIVYTGYADCPLAVGCFGNTITNPVFPFPWYGALNTQFIAQQSAVDTSTNGDPDTSAIRVDNTGTVAITVNDVSVTGCGGTLDLWGTAPFAYPYSVPAHSTIVFSSTAGDNFDGSEICSSAPQVSVAVNGVAKTYKDDIANAKHGALVGGSNPNNSGDESTPWTKVSKGVTKIVILPKTLSTATVGTPYDVLLGAQDSNGAPKFTTTVTNLPPGITLSSKGVLSGTPTLAGTYTFKVTVKDTALPVHDKGAITYTLTVS